MAAAKVGSIIRGTYVAGSRQNDSLITRCLTAGARAAKIKEREREIFPLPAVCFSPSFFPNQQMAAASKRRNKNVCERADE